MDINKIIEECKKINDEYHYFNTIDEGLNSKSSNCYESSIRKTPKKQGDGKLNNIAISVKDCICVKGLESRAGSKILEKYKPVFDATVIEKVKQQGAIIIGKTAQDAFGFGSFSTNVGKDMKIPLNPFDKERACGGSSGGSAGITQKASFRHITLSESTGGSIVCPASFCGVIGLCPTYGRVSRYGLMDYANSLDKIGPMARSMDDIALIMEIISGYDEKESTTLNEEVPKYSDFLKKDIKGMKIGIIKEAFGKGIDKEVKEKVEQGIKKLEQLGAKTEFISLPLTQKYGVETYYLLAMCEASTNLAKYCGMRYGAAEKLEGSFNEYFSKVRSDYFNDESKRRIIIGTFARMAGYRDAYYIKAAKVRTKIIEEYKKAFAKFDLLLSPTMPFVAPKFKDIEKLTPLQNYMADILTVGPNLAGLPHISIPAGFNKDKMPIGLMLIADHLKEEKLIQAGSKL
ncbi:MAG: aspartyl/glutamyl-tRNA amidotransferase subunit A [Nanoarchaeota archaeon]|nr:aspartyl/glutamyl-tRNA amidotransferase subunit A [Nanoarchaeota archaeon]MBU1004612.1 aspartyl/glutamyl-tRNA amidotransferase subunit A [Nanoarchaeota archaeon]MBU1945524.1 aspartyl/glutamyl-tRNA amidotransferase subunit A [Nanoarchaeota archaeon]